MERQFPLPVLVPQEVLLERKKRLKQLTSSCAIGVAIRSSIIIVELIGVWMFGSVAVLLDALASIVDVVSSIPVVNDVAVHIEPYYPDDH